MGNRVTLTKRGNALSLVVDDLELIPDTYRRTKTSSEPDKVAIKVALDRGEEIAGVIWSRPSRSFENSGSRDRTSPLFFGEKDV